MSNKRMMFTLGAVSLVVAGTLLWYREVMKKIYSQGGAGGSRAEISQEADGIPPPPPSPPKLESEGITNYQEPILAPLDSDDKPNSSWALYTNDKLGIEFKHPSDWMVQESQRHFDGREVTDLIFVYTDLYTHLEREASLRLVIGKGPLEQYLGRPLNTFHDHQTILMNGMKVIIFDYELVSLFLENKGVVYNFSEAFGSDDDTNNIIFAILGTFRFVR